MSSNQLCAEQIAEFKEAFSVFDRNGDGAIDKEELGFILGALGQNVSDSELTQLIDEYDLDANGTIDLDEFLQMVIGHMKHGSAKEQTLAAFQTFDKTGSGFITAEDIRPLLALLGEKIAHDDLDEMIR
jgi:calmodulin